MSHAAGQYVTHAEFMSDLIAADCPSPIPEGRVPGSYQEPAKAPESRDDVFGKPVGKILVFGVVA
jgi:hypothetical protein